MLRKINRIVLLTLCIALTVVVIAQLALILTPPRLDKMDWKDGDIVFQTNFDTQGIAVMLASKSPYTHMGFIRLKNGQPVVVEAVGPVTETELQKWVARGSGKRIAVMRLKNMPKGAFPRILARAKKEYGKPYDIFFLPDDKAYYCSELVKTAFDAVGITLGQVQQVKDLAASGAMDKIIEQRWQRYPLCSGVKGMTMEKCRKIIMEQRLVTPASIARDDKLEEVYSNYPLD